MKVLLIAPPQPIFNGSYENLGVSWPMGILYVAASTARAGYDVRIVDAFVGGCIPFTTEGRHNIGYLAQSLVNPEGEITNDGVVGIGGGSLKFMIKYDIPDVIGISLMFSSFHHIVPILIQTIKEAAPHAKIVLGGAHATQMPEKLMEINGIDYVVTGEGEVTFPKLLHAIEHNEPTDNIPGVYPTPWELIPELDSIFPPTYYMLPVDHYFAVLGRREMVMITSRGCPFNCRFCSIAAIEGRKWRAHSVDRVLAEMEMIQVYGAHNIMFEDDNMSVDRKRFCGILEGIVKRGWKLHLNAHNLLLTTLDTEVLTLMKHAGFTEVPLAPESGCDRVLKEEMNKHLTIADTERVVRESVALGLEPSLRFVIGMPGETWAEIEQTGEFARRMVELGARGIWFAIATPMRGTALYDELEAAGKLPPEIEYQFSYGHGTFDGPDWTKEQITKWRTAKMRELNKKQ